MNKKSQKNGEISNLRNTAQYQFFYVKNSMSKNINQTEAYRQLQEDVFAAQRALARQITGQSISPENANDEAQKLVRKKD